MIYYYYGANPDSEGVLRTNEMPVENPPVRRYGDLIIEEDTIYEIDESCLNCKKRKNK